jgi:biofilm PGA synthesis N-glycosyltransferase PgaC
MTTTLLIIYILLTSYLSFFALIFIFLSVKVWFLKPTNKEGFNNKQYGSISILVPAYNEGEGLIDTIKTISNQDYTGLVKIYILANNSSDNFVEYLKKFYNYKNNDENILKLLNNDKRQISLIYTNLTQKKDKINFWLPSTSSDYIGILDADHRVENNWISTSLFKMEKDKTKIIQSRRQPLNISTIFQMWDSTQNHIGNEVLNYVLNEKNSSVFFTGTTCIFNSSIFKKYNFSNSLTEDTYLSYDLICNKESISYNKDSSSYEEVAFDAKSYVFRRRRWSAGHNKTFFDHIKQIVLNPLKFSTKIKLFLHGQFFLIPVIVVCLINTIGIYFFLQFTKNIQSAVVLASTILALALSTFFQKKGNNLIIDSAASFIWIFPQISIIAIWFYKLFGSEIYYYIISFPFKKYFYTLEITLLFIPLLVVISGLLFFKKYKNYKNLLLIPTYPFFMFLDIYAYFLGFIDFLLKKYNWVEIKRQNFISEEIVPINIRSQIQTGKTIRLNHKKIIWTGIVILSVLLINDLLAFDNCGETKKFLWKPLVIHPSSPTSINLDIEKNIVGTSTVEILIKNTITTNSEVELKNYLDGKVIFNKKIDNNEENIQKLYFPLGWDTHKIDLVIKSSNISCERKQYFSTTFKELKNNSLFINGEKFLIKGIIPSFSNKLTNLSMDIGLKEIKDTGANTIRFYHYINNEIRDISTKYNLMVIDQPDKSTWGEINLNNTFNQKNYISRYKKMIKGNEGYPFLLFNIFGNEWELGDNNQNVAIPKIKKLIENISATSSDISSYSTYLTFVDYPVDILGVNMLDTGNTYWEKAISLLKKANKPFYASEFGGFVAFWEKAPADLRINRIKNYWDILLKNNSLGAVFFESHDNWAQPVVNGYNDPFNSEQPDDLRGLWDKNNNEKLELKFLKELFSDFEVTILNQIIKTDTKEINLVLKNKREYSLKNVIVDYQDKQDMVGDFNPLESRTIKLAIENLQEINTKIQLKFNYTTHSGFKEISSNEIILPIINESPVILNEDFIKTDSPKTSTKGRLIFSDKIEILIPETWEQFKFNNKVYKNNIGEKNIISVENPYHNINGLQFSTDNYTWQTFDSKKIQNGIYYIKFKIPKINSSERYLILSGLGTNAITYNINGKSGSIYTHNYRENVIDLNIFTMDDLDKEIIININRNQTGYISEADAIDGKAISIDIEQPLLFAPINIEVTNNI